VAEPGLGSGFRVNGEVMTRRCILAWYALVPVLMAGSLHAAGQELSASGFVNFPFSVDGMERTAALYVPPDYDSSKEWPLIVFLHGGGGNGNNNGNALREGFERNPLVQAIRNYPESFPALVAFPRCPEGRIWSPVPADPVQSAWRLNFHGREPAPDAEEHITAVIEATIAGFAVDEDRVVITGYSMGGEGSIRYAALHPERIAAVAPAAGSAVIVLEDAPVLAGMGVWMFQGETDNISTTELAGRMIDAIRANGGNPRYTEYTGVGHGMLGRVFEDPEVMTWMLDQRRSDR